MTTNINVQINGRPDNHKEATDSNRKAWDAIADWWEHKQSEAGDDGNDMFTQCLLPEVADLAQWQPGETVLDLGAGSGIICRLFAGIGAKVTGLDYSQPMLDKARKRTANSSFAFPVQYDFIDLMDIDNMKQYADDHPDVVEVDLHPAFSKPAGHRGMEIFEDPVTGKQQLVTYIKVMRYLNVAPAQSEAVRGQPEPLEWAGDGCHAGADVQDRGRRSRARAKLPQLPADADAPGRPFDTQASRAGTRAVRHIGDESWLILLNNDLEDMSSSGATNRQRCTSRFSSLV
ncbi:hypothetical protein LTR53_013397 [Teratosphaeriaceae sp. CCFEE 6253]|nr:hypothetical protein LTR53_013397 [Teratosphaeriaceae sp. CCFEE 6253]